VPPYAIVAGNPARVVRLRHDERTVERLLALRWWDWPIERVTAAVGALAASDLEALERMAPR
jgi:virginiamycin A acetyltransferase